MSLSSAETSSCSRWGACARRLRCLWTVQRWVGTSPHREASACSSPVPPSTIRKSGLRSPRLTRSSRTARHAWLVSPPIFLTASSTFWPSSRTPSTTRSTIEVAFRSSRARTTVPSRTKRTIGSSASEWAFQASQSVLTLRHTRLTVSLLIAPPNTATSARRTRAVGSGKISAGNQRIGLPGSPLVGPQRRALPLACLAVPAVEPGTRHRDLDPTKGPHQRARSMTMPVAGNTTRQRLATFLLGGRAAAIAWPAQRRFKLALNHCLNELAHATAQASFDWIKPVVENSRRRDCFRLQGSRLRAIVAHGVVSTGARAPDRLGFSTRRLRHLQFQPNSGRHQVHCWT